MSEWIGSGFETYPRYCKGEQDDYDCLKPEDKISVILILIMNEVDSPDPSSGRHPSSCFCPGLMM